MPVSDRHCAAKSVASSARPRAKPALAPEKSLRGCLERVLGVGIVYNGDNYVVDCPVG